MSDMLQLVVLMKRQAKACRTFTDILRRVRVLGIDPGSQTTGWGVVEGDGRRYSLVAYGSIKAPSTLAFSARLLRRFFLLTLQK